MGGAVGPERSGSGAHPGVWWVLASALLFSTSGSAQRIAEAGSTPMGVGFGRLFVGTMVLIAILPRSGGSRRDMVALWGRPAALVAAVGAAGYQAAFFAGVRGAGVALGTLIVVGSAPIFTAVFGRVAFGERPGRAWLAATGVCLGGLLLLSAQGLGGGSVAGVLSSLAAGASIATYTVAAKRLLAEGWRSITIMASTFTVGCVLLLPLVATQPLAWVATPRGAALVLYLGVFTMVGANWLFMRGLELLPAASVGTLMLAEPLLATIAGVALFGEELGLLGMAGVALVVTGLALQTRAVSSGGSNLRPGPPPPSRSAVRR